MSEPGVSVVRIDVTPDPAHVRVVRLVAVSLARLNGIAEEVVEDVRLAVGEACGRAVAAHDRAEVESPVVVDFEGDVGLTVTVTDTVPLPHAEPLPDGDAASAPDSTTRARQHSDGAQPAAALISQLEGLADAVTVTTGRDGTAVTMRWSSPG